MTVTVRFAATAERDLAEISTFTEAEWGPSQAKAYLVAIADAVDRIVAFPALAVQSAMFAADIASSVSSGTIYIIATKGQGSK